MDAPLSVDEIEKSVLRQQRDTALNDVAKLVAQLSLAQQRIQQLEREMGTCGNRHAPATEDGAPPDLTE